MKTLCFTVLTLLSVAFPSRAGLSFIGNAYAILDANGSGNHSYAVDSYNNQTFNGSLNGLSISAGQSLLIGGQVETYERLYGTTAWLGYKLFSGSTLVSENDSINLPYYQQSGNNDQWQQLASTSGINLDQGLSPGTYTLQVWFGANNGGTTIYDSNGGNNFSATFTVTPIPEPAQWSLASAVGLLVVAGVRTIQVNRSKQREQRAAAVEV